MLGGRDIRNVGLSISVGLGHGLWKALRHAWQETARRWEGPHGTGDVRLEWRLLDMGANKV